MIRRALREPFIIYLFIHFISVIQYQLLVTGVKQWPLALPGSLALASSLSLSFTHKHTNTHRESPVLLIAYHIGGGRK